MVSEETDASWAEVNAALWDNYLLPWDLECSAAKS